MFSIIKISMIFKKIMLNYYFNNNKVTTFMLAIKQYQIILAPYGEIITIVCIFTLISSLLQTPLSRFSYKHDFREHFHQVGSILFQTNFIITQLAMFYFYVLTTIGGLLQELNVQWSLLARCPTRDLVCSPPRLCS